MYGGGGGYDGDGGDPVIDVGMRKFTQHQPSYQSMSTAPMMGGGMARGVDRFNSNANNRFF